MTDLGDQGNARAAERLARYDAKPRAELAAAPGRRVLLTGFGLFVGVERNVSGVVAEALATGAAEPRGVLAEADAGGRRWRRGLVAGGVALDVTVLVVDVLWDLAAAVILREAERLQPELVLMTGRGQEGVVFEAGALNAARPMRGFRWDGAEDEANAPHGAGARVLACDPEDCAIALSWDAASACAAAAPHMRALGFEPRVAGGARIGNDYVCNNVSYVLQRAVEGQAIELAGGRISVAPALPRATRVGFVHLPAGAPMDAAAVETWGQALLAAAAAALPPQ